MRFFWEHFIWIDLHSVDRMIIMYDHLRLFSEISPRAHSANWEHNRVLKQSYLMNFFYYYSKELRKAPCNRFRKQNRLLTFCNTPCNFASQWIARINRTFYSETWLNLIEWVFKTERLIPTAHEQILKSERANQNARNDLENMRFNNALLGNSYFQNISSYLESMLVPEIRKKINNNDNEILHKFAQLTSRCILVSFTVIFAWVSTTKTNCFKVVPLIPYFSRTCCIAMPRTWQNEITNAINIS